MTSRDTGASSKGSCANTRPRAWLRAASGRSTVVEGDRPREGRSPFFVLEAGEGFLDGDVSGENLERLAEGVLLLQRRNDRVGHVLARDLAASAQGESALYRARAGP